MQNNPFASTARYTLYKIFHLGKNIHLLGTCCVKGQIIVVLKTFRKIYTSMRLNDELDSFEQEVFSTESDRR